MRTAHYDFTYGLPSAFGARTLPTRPATAKIVATRIGEVASQ
jgi:hypothetical protein